VTRHWEVLRGSVAVFEVARYDVGLDGRRGMAAQAMHLVVYLLPQRPTDFVAVILEEEEGCYCSLDIIPVQTRLETPVPERVLAG